MLNRVLLVDDDDVTLMICKLRLLHSKFCKEISTVENGESADKYLEEQLALPENERKIPDIIFLDINMIGMSGWDFLEEFENKYKHIFKNINIEILTSSLDPRDEEIAKKHPLVKGFISKPLTDESLKKLSESDLYKSFFL